MVILLLPSNLVLLGGVLGAVPHGELVVDIEETIDDEGVLSGHVAEDGVFSRKQESGRSVRLKKQKYRRQAWTYGAFDIDSIPPATMTSRTPSWMFWEANMMDFKPEAQTLLMVVASVDSGMLHGQQLNGGASTARDHRASANPPDVPCRSQQECLRK